MRLKAVWPLLVTLTCACAAAPQYDVVIRHGTVYDGTGVAPAVEDIGILGDRIAAPVPS
jgi:N-acyl-D-amino-acid deacylase